MTYSQPDVYAHVRVGSGSWNFWGWVALNALAAAIMTTPTMATMAKTILVQFCSFTICLLVGEERVLGVCHLRVLLA